jgi:hypothetical protein
MKYYPNLITGSMAQYPLVRKRTLRTILNHTLDGRQTKLSDPMAGTVEWQLRYMGITSAEAARLKAFFEECEGRLRSFVFADPIDNLLARSEELGDETWIRDPLVQVQNNVGDPLGTQRACRLTNIGQGEQGLRQAISSTGANVYSFSFYARSAVPITVTLRSSVLAESFEKTFECSSSWRRLKMITSLGVEQGPVWFELALHPGTIIDVFGVQVETQVEPSPYRKTTNRGGIYETARFDVDDIAFVAEGVEQFSTQLTVLSRIEG